MKRKRFKVSISTKIILIVLFYIIITALFSYFFLSKEIIKGATEYTIEGYKSIIKDFADDIIKYKLFNDLDKLEIKLKKIKVNINKYNIMIIKNIKITRKNKYKL